MFWWTIIAACTCNGVFNQRPLQNAFSSPPVHQVLQLLHGLWFPVSSTGENLPAVIHSDDTVCRVYEETAEWEAKFLVHVAPIKEQWALLYLANVIFAK